MTEYSPGLIVDPQTLRAQIHDPDLRIFDCRFALSDTELGRRLYHEGHIPGAIYAHLDEHLSSAITPTSGRHPLPDPSRFAAWLGQCGVSPESRVVVYDDLNGAFAGRLWWMLRWVGHARVAVLEGGLQAWEAAGGTLTPDVPRHRPQGFEARVRDDLWVTSDDLADALARGDIRVIDARAPERYRGEVEPTDPVAGHIPGALNLPLTENLDAEGRFLPAARLRARFLDAMGDGSATTIAHSCGSGVTACHNLLAMELAGLSGSKLYVGSWSEWIRSPERAVATGEAS
ncbi:sulfurtransferase [Thiocystis violacea]|uniref:sulfurtransferase n=1 Tax=Thiocystis violacea TaxID=13725 RepID=UPI001902CDB3|nr:sulfurtransferase [Thiocystis violacea]MBK1722535.1 sulfurtransferase [Thiocystis violacea]